MIHVVLYEPEIPPNTGNIIRLCANTGATLHLIEPLGFSLDEKALRRAGLDYHEWARVRIHAGYDQFLTDEAPKNLWSLTTKGRENFFAHSFPDPVYFLFGPETRGLPESVLDSLGSQRCLRLPMQDDSRSLNLANAVSVVVYEAWRQVGFVSMSRGSARA